MSALLVVPPERRERWLLDSILFCTTDISSSVNLFDEDEAKSRLVKKLPLLFWYGFSFGGSSESFSQLYLRCLSGDEDGDKVEGGIAATRPMENELEQSMIAVQ